MKPEHLDSLLADRALDELPPEVAALLEEHLSRDPDAARQAAGFDTTLRLAREAVAVPAERPAALNLPRLRRERPFTLFRLAPVEILRVAAGLAAGLALGWLLRPQPVDVPIIASATPIIQPAPLQAAAPTTNFWSVTRFAPDYIHAQARKSP